MGYAKLFLKQYKKKSFHLVYCCQPGFTKCFNAYLPFHSDYFI